MLTPKKMPELPDITVYIERLERRIVGARLQRARVLSPHLLRTIAPPLDSLVGRRAQDIRRLGKRIAVGFEGDVWIVLHLMVAGRLHWADAAPPPSKRHSAIFAFDSGALSLTEAGAKKRASLHVAEGDKGLEAHDPKGLEVEDACLDSFGQALMSRNRTLKRMLTDPRVFSGIGNAYSDEILHRARLSPVTLSHRLSVEETRRLLDACQTTLQDWTEKLRQEVGEGFPERVTAFRKGMAAHGRFGKPCPVCKTTIQRIRYASNETNYCPKCQTGGKLLADRSLSALLKKDWPKTPEALEELRSGS